MRRSLERERVIFLLTISGLVSLTIIALVVDGDTGVWAKHPFLGGLATGAVTLAFTALIIDRFLSHRDNQRWRRVAAVAYRGIARESRGISAGLASLYCDLDHEIGASYLEPDWTPGDLSPIGEIREIPDGKAAVSAFAAKGLPPEDDPFDLLPEPRVRFLLKDTTWVQVASDYLAELVDRNRAAVAHWAPLMMAAEEPRDLLDAFASLNDELFVLHVKLRHLVQRGHGGGATDDFVAHWRIIDGKARLLTNRLWFLAGEGHYSLRVPTSVASMEVRDAFRTVGRLGPWITAPEPIQP